MAVRRSRKTQDRPLRTSEIEKTRIAPPIRDVTGLEAQGATLEADNSLEQDLRKIFAMLKKNHREVMARLKWMIADMKVFDAEFGVRGELERRARAQNRTWDDAFVDEALKRDIEHRCQELAAYKRPKRLFLRTEEFPKTTTGKIKRQGIVPDAAGVRPVGAAASAVA